MKLRNFIYSNNFKMKYMDDADYVIGIKIF